MNYNRIIKIQRMDERGQWKDYHSCHAAINKASGKEYLQAGAIQSQQQLVFTLRYCSAIAKIRLKTQQFRVLYNGATFKVADYDDFKEQHRAVKLLGVSYGHPC